jgi:hypothetical protein
LVEGFFTSGVKEKRTQDAWVHLNLMFGRSMYSSLKREKYLLLWRGWVNREIRIKSMVEVIESNAFVCKRKCGSFVG